MLFKKKKGRKNERKKEKKKKQLKIIKKGEDEKIAKKIPNPNYKIPKKNLS